MKAWSLWQEQFGFDLEGGFEHNSVEQLSYCTCFLRKAGLRLATRVTRAQFVAKAHFGCVNVWLSFCPIITIRPRSHDPSASCTNRDSQKLVHRTVYSAAVA